MTNPIPKVPTLQRAGQSPGGMCSLSPLLSLMLQAWARACRSMGHTVLGTALWEPPLHLCAGLLGLKVIKPDLAREHVFLNPWRVKLEHTELLFTTGIPGPGWALGCGSRADGSSEGKKCRTRVPTNTHSTTTSTPGVTMLLDRHPNLPPRIPPSTALLKQQHRVEFGGCWLAAQLLRADLHVTDWEGTRERESVSQLCVSNSLCWAPGSRIKPVHLLDWWRLAMWLPKSWKVRGKVKCYIFHFYSATSQFNQIHLWLELRSFP